ncbi:MAG: hypothetical protein LBC02_10255 [Planctomycetaceae bacterium]|jgi:hypothetical protein|nr:hypothetical protein [Planctomycetaceae bacterium]
MNTNDLISIDIVQKAREYDWLLCIFFSVDIEGATAYKSNIRIQSREKDWCLVFNRFYEDFPNALSSAYFHPSNDQTKGQYQYPTIKIILPELWKFIGDEILFYAPITSPEQTLEHIRAFRKTIINYNKTILQPNGIQCKGTAWLAGFPVRNRIVLIDNNPNNKKKKRNKPTAPIIDFIGASIDTGFRLTKFASPRRLVVSLDLLWLLAESYDKHSGEDDYAFIKNDIKYAGKHELKGVFSGKSYPIFWIESNITEPVEDQFLPDYKKCDASNIIRFCKEFSNTLGTSIFPKPFIVGEDNEGQVKENQVEKDFQQQREALRNYKSQEDLPDDINKMPTSASGKPAKPRKPIDRPKT